LPASRLRADGLPAAAAGSERGDSGGRDAGGSRGGGGDGDGGAPNAAARGGANANANASAQAGAGGAGGEKTRSGGSAASAAAAAARVLLDDNFLEFTEGRPLPLHDRAKEYFNRAVFAVGLRG
jgi:hypothetical protein